MNISDLTLLACLHGPSDPKAYIECYASRIQVIAPMYKISTVTHGVKTSDIVNASQTSFSGLASL